MATAAARVRFSPSAEPNVIPFIDVLLVLLIIFMVTAPKPTTDLAVDLPRGRSIAANIRPIVVEVRRGAQGAVFGIGAAQVSLNDLGTAALAAMLAGDPRTTPADARVNGRIFVHADLDVGYQSVVSAVDALEHARFQRVSIAAQNADAPG